MMNTQMNEMVKAPTHNFSLRHNGLGRLVFVDADGSEHEGAVPVRAFPIGAPDEGIALVSADGHELAWIEHWSDVSPEIRRMMEAELATREFMPEISRIVGVSSFATPTIWEVETNRGNTSFTLKGEEDIRRLPQSALLISDSHGIQFLVRDIKALDKPSKKILDRFL
ncbi:hypothetical protein hmeg3_09915 [Herbaspirillum sp. meg3]|uniref:cyanophycin metabolism-associated DUF1854 family protein n=1 Tax=Herbaspirillum sp. meg3 TaxID=2025949 RepID=UPI000B97E261|nr:DUF1854 domain-containing protein [Herbaspirillum sp. meg3]ASU38580.1 hypothetical protein hmeg3_09915 [Herbaspirillum sp. meg3]